MSEISINEFHALNDELPNGEVYLRGTTEYEAAISIGNLLYRMITPQAVVLVKSVEEVQTTVLFAKKFEIHLTIKNGAHSYAAYCLNQGGIVLDLSALRKTIVDMKNMTVTIQGGAVWKDVYAKLAELDPRKLVIGGQCPTVGVSGFTLGGGLSPFSRSYGLGVDSLLEMELVTADGKLVTVGPKDPDKAKSDLFWAVRGGGGGNFGVTVKIKSKLHDLYDPTGVVVCGNLSWKLAEKQGQFREMMKLFNKTKWPPRLSIDALWHSDSGQDLLGDMTILFNGPMSECLKVIAPLLDYAPDINLREMRWMDWVQQELQGGFGTTSKIYHHHISFIFGNGAIDSELVDKVLSLLNQAKNLLSDKSLFPVLADSDGCSRASVHFLWDHIGGKTAEKSSTDTAFFWRKGEYVANIKLAWSHPSQSECMLEFEQNCKKVLEPYTLQGKAAYLNYIDDTEINWQEAYYGDNYKRLMEIKKRWDPYRFWWFPQAIGEIKDRVGYPKEETSIEAPMEGKLPERWERFSVKDPSAIDAAGNNIKSVLRANLATREREKQSEF